MSQRTPLILLSLALAGASCYDFHVEGPEDPTPIDPPRLVSVTIEYRQPGGCLSPPEGCDDPVVFFASWLPPGGSLPLRRDAGGPIWRGRAEGVAVNFPPRDEPYRVRVFDPHLRGDTIGGVTGNRLTVGGQLLTRFEAVGTVRENALVYIDENGIGHNPF